ncbi:hypothetical protein CMI39_00435 [Candidatus Pacearchaeota archaeon]|jgi:hypothetical protein|nr:hypothetical protein [Candidatus Pacearchaeota archaeon]|tara:strand:+ start:3438 stop:4409 length:972 start_codon:yes stop_codon:yes gene_type:complete
MTKNTKYGIISDVHDNPRVVPLAIDVLKSKGVEKLLVNGDIGGTKETLQDSQNYTAFILDSIGKSGLESFVMPGSHETLLGYTPVINHFADKYNNIFDIQKISHVDNNGHRLIFLPGSDFLCGGEYEFGNGNLSSGKYFYNGENLFNLEPEQYAQLKEGQRQFQYANINDIKEYANKPEKTIVVSHVPRKFHNIDEAVDVAEFGEVTEDFNLNGDNVKKGAVFPLPVAMQIAKTGAPVLIKKENRGNGDLKNLYEDLGITKAVSAHFHESGHRANDDSGNHVRENTFTDNLFYNSGCLDNSQAGILIVREDAKVSYENVKMVF